MKKILILLTALVLISGIFIIANFQKNKNNDVIYPTNDLYDIVNNSVPGSSIKFGISYPSFRNSYEINFSLQQLKELNAKLIRYDILWKYREPVKGNFNWDPMDMRINAVENNQLFLLLTVKSDGPDWACSNIRNKETCVYSDSNDLENFLRVLLSRYSGKIDKIQFGNEWEIYAGTAENFVTLNNILYDVTKELSPSTKVVLGGVTSKLPIYTLVCKQNKVLDFSGAQFREGYNAEKIHNDIKKNICTMDNLETYFTYVLKNAKYDLLDIHLYDDPKNWQNYVEILKSYSSKPIIVSEFGGPNPDVEIYSDSYQAKRLKEYLLTINSLPIEEAYFFKLVDSPETYHSKSGLFDEKGNKKPAYYVFKEFNK